MLSDFEISDLELMNGKRRCLEIYDDEEEEDDDYDDDDDGKSDSSIESVNFDECENKVREAHRALAKLICYENTPPRIDKDLYFLRFIRRLNPNLRLEFSMIESECLEVFKEEKARIKETFTKYDGQISLSADVLRYERFDYASQLCLEYLCLRVHFIDENWKLKNWVINYRRVMGMKDVLPHEAIIEALEDWGIGNKVSSLTMVNGEFNDETAELVKGHFQGKNEVLQLNLYGKPFRVCCCGDVLTQMVQDAFEEMRCIIDQVRQLYSFGKSLPLWYLTTIHLKDAFELWVRGEFSSKDVTDHYGVHSAEEWKKIEAVSKLVDSMYEIANKLFETKHSTANLYLYHLHDLRAVLTQASTDSSNPIKSVAENMLKKFDKYWNDMFLLLSIATVLDPRFKMKYIEFTCSKFNGNEGNLQAVSVMETFRRLYDDYATRFPPVDNNSPSENSLSESDEELSSSLVNGCYHQFVQSSSQLPKSELDLYFGESVFWSLDFNSLSWWREASAKYPTLSRMARDFLAIPMSVATSFEAFYTEPRPVDERLLSVRPKLTNALMCTRNWYQRPKKQQ